MKNNTMTLDLNTPTEELRKALATKQQTLPSWADVQKDYEPSMHRVLTDTNVLKDKVRPDGTIDKSSRIAIGIEKIATARLSEFCFAIPVKRVYSNVGDDERKQEAVKALEAIYKSVRIDTENSRRAVAYFASCEVATIWYAVDKPNRLYGFDSKFKLRCKSYSPMEGYELYPYFDQQGDMLALSIGYKLKSEGKDYRYFETFTESKHYLWKELSGRWELEVDEAITILKIPASYISRPKPVFADITGLRDELEITLSRNGNIIAYNSAPVLKVAGELEGVESRGEGQRVFKVEQGGDVAYVSWSQSVEALKYQVDNLLRFAFMQLQIPDLSFDSMKGLGNIGFDARQTLLTDAHLKVGDEAGALVEFLERECNVIKAFLKMMHVPFAEVLDEINVEHIITPYIQNDEEASIKRRILANGGKPIESQRESIERYGWSDDADATLRQIQEEAQAEARSAGLVDVMSSAAY